MALKLFAVWLGLAVGNSIWAFFTDVSAPQAFERIFFQAVAMICAGIILRK